MEIIVQKFGGTSVADLDKIKNVANIIKLEVIAGNYIIVVLSAMAGETNALITKCAALSKLNHTDHMREYDAALASGEIVTAALLALQLQNMGLKAQSLQGWQIPFYTNEVHGNAQVTNINSNKILQLLKSGIIPVITGFQGINQNGDVSTLGKGGSDTSAAMIAAAVKADRCDIYTDVEGVYSADPRIIHDAKKIDHIHIEELYALCSSGAKVLHPRAALAAKRYGFKMRILSSFTKNTGTIVHTKENNMENTLITAITSNKNLLKIDIDHQNTDFFYILNQFVQNNITLEQTYNIAQGVSTIIAHLAEKNKCEKLLQNLKDNSSLSKYTLNTNVSTVTIVGYGIKNDQQLNAQLIEILSDHNIKILSTNISDIKMSILIDDQNNEKVIKLLHDYCFKQ